MWKSDWKKKTQGRNCTWQRHFFHSAKSINNFRWSDIWKRTREKEREEEKQIKSEIDLQKLKDEVDVGEVPKELEFYFGCLNKNFFYTCQNLGLNEDNTSFIDFLSFDIGSQIFRGNSLSMHIETGNVYFDGYNTNESIYEFLLSQQDEIKQKIHRTVSYSDTFSNYMVAKWLTSRFFLQIKMLSIYFIDLMTSFFLEVNQY